MLSVTTRNPRLIYSLIKTTLKPYHSLISLKTNLSVSELKKSFSGCPGSCPPKKEPPCCGDPGKWPTGNRITYKFNPETETALNEHIKAELKAFYYYLSMATYFNRVDVALPGCRNYFLKMHREEHEHAMSFINYINLRGGSVCLNSIEAPTDQDWKCPLNAFKTALCLEQDIAAKLEAAHDCAQKHNDLSACDFIVTNFMQEQVDSVNELGKIVSVLSGIGDQGLARYLFDQNLLNTCPVSKADSKHKHGKCGH